MLRCLLWSFLSLYLGICRHFLIFSIYVVVLECPSQCLALVGGEKVENEGGKWHLPFQSPGSHFTWRERGNSNG